MKTKRLLPDKILEGLKETAEKYGEDPSREKARLDAWQKPAKGTTAKPFLDEDFVKLDRLRRWLDAIEQAARGDSSDLGNLLQRDWEGCPSFAREAIIEILLNPPPNLDKRLSAKASSAMVTFSILPALRGMLPSDLRSRRPGAPRKHSSREKKQIVDDYRRGLARLRASGKLNLYGKKGEIRKQLAEKHGRTVRQIRYILDSECKSGTLGYKVKRPAG